MPPDGSGMQGTTLLSAETVEVLLSDRRRPELVRPLKLALLKLASEEAAHLMTMGAYDAALPAALGAVRQGQALFCSSAPQLFPLYLQAAQANLGLGRSKQCEDFLGLASWLVLKEPTATTNAMRSQLSRLYGQLYASQGKSADALAAFAEDVYYCALEHGPEDVRTSLGYYNLSKVFKADGDTEKALSCNDHVVRIWLRALTTLVLGADAGVLLKRATEHGGEVTEEEDEGEEGELGGAGGEDGGVHAHAQGGADAHFPLEESRCEVVAMLQDACALRSEVLGGTHALVGDARLVSALALAHVGDTDGQSSWRLPCTPPAGPKQDGTNHQEGPRCARRCLRHTRARVRVRRDTVAYTQRARCIRAARAHYAGTFTALARTAACAVCGRTPASASSAARHAPQHELHGNIAGGGIGLPRASTRAPGVRAAAHAAAGTIQPVSAV